MMLKLPRVIAHRGASGYAPENTAAAFIKTKELGVQWVEVDVALTQDEIPVILHDETLPRTTNGRGNIYDITANKLLQLDAGSWFHPSFSSERILTLPALLKLLQTLSLGVNIELKPYGDETKQLAKKTLQALDECWLKEAPPPLLSSFSLHALQELRQLNDGIYLGLNVETFSNEWFKKIETLHLNSIHLPEKLITPELTQKIKSKHYQVLSFTVDDPAQALQFFDWGVDAVFSNYPDRILRELL